MIKINKLEPVFNFGANCYAIESSGEWAVIDPSVPLLDALNKHPEMQGKIKYVLLTHGHFDHILELEGWATVAPVYVGVGDFGMLSDSHLNCYKMFFGIDGGYNGPANALQSGDTLTLGRDTLSVISVPGHTPGCVAYICGEAAFVGDLIFSGGSYGRCDLPGGDFHALRQSISNFLLLFDGENIYPGHGPSFLKDDYKKYYYL